MVRLKANRRATNTCVGTAHTRVKVVAHDVTAKLAECTHQSSVHLILLTMSLERLLTWNKQLFQIENMKYKHSPTVRLSLLARTCLISVNKFRLPPHTTEAPAN